jgi:hypothetical protein
MELFKPTYNGIIEDTRSHEEKIRDWDSREIALGSGTGSKITKIPIKVYDQQGTSSCTAHAILSMMEYNQVLKKEVSRYLLYRKRFNFPFEGSNATDLLKKSHSDHDTNGGLTYYDDVAHPLNLTEIWANTLPFVIGKNITVPFNYFTIFDWNELEAKVNSGIAVTLAFYSTVNEWSREWVEERDIVTPNNAKVRHQVTLIPKGAFRENGKLWFSVHDSAKFGNRHLRYATLDFFRNRVIVQPQFAIPKAMPVEPPKVNKTLSAVKLGDRGQAVTNLQGFLADKGFLERRFVTGFYGPITQKAVLWFQLYNHEEFDIDIPELLKLNGEWFGSQSVKVARTISSR